MRFLMLVTCWAPLLATGCKPDPVNTPGPEPTTSPAPVGPVGDDADRDGFSVDDGDCDDLDDAIHPDADDLVGDEVDQNCDLVDGIDADGDGHASSQSGGGDCADNNAALHPGAEEILGDGIDQNCDGLDVARYQQLCSGKFHSCGLDEAGSGLIYCWGSDADGQVSGRPLDAGWKQLDCGYEFSCAVAHDGELACWGRDTPGALPVSTAPTDGTWSSVHVGYEHSCVLDAQGAATCWGADDAGQVSGRPQRRFMSLALGQAHSCGIESGNELLVSCWGDDSHGQVSQMPDPNYFNGWLQLTSGADHTCGIREDQGLHCWGSDRAGQVTPPSAAGPYSHIDAFGDVTCGVIEAQQLSCWGLDTDGQVSDAPLDGAVSLFWAAAGEDHGCAIRNGDQRAICWGKGDLGQASPPAF